jgi:hypothetical protein
MERGTEAFSEVVLLLEILHHFGLSILVLVYKQLVEATPDSSDATDVGKGTRQKRYNVCFLVFDDVSFVGDDPVGVDIILLHIIHAVRHVFDAVVLVFLFSYFSKAVDGSDGHFVEKSLVIVIFCHVKHCVVRLQHFGILLLQ